MSDSARSLHLSIFQLHISGHWNVLKYVKNTFLKLRITIFYIWVPILPTYWVPTLSQRACILVRNMLGNTVYEMHLSKYHWNTVETLNVMKFIKHEDYRKNYFSKFAFKDFFNIFQVYTKLI